MKYSLAISTGLAIIPLLDDEDFKPSDVSKEEFREAIRAIISHEDVDEDDESSGDAIKSLTALRKAIK